VFGFARQALSPAVASKSDSAVRARHWTFFVLISLGYGVISAAYLGHLSPHDLLNGLMLSPSGFFYGLADRCSPALCVIPIAALFSGGLRFRSKERRKQIDVGSFSIVYFLLLGLMALGQIAGN
jgi:hypothetical protein